MRIVQQMSHLFRDIVHDYPRYWGILRDAAIGYWDDNALSRGAAIAYYTIFSIGPVLLIVVAIAGFFFGEQAAQGAILNQFTGLLQVGGEK